MRYTGDARLGRQSFCELWRELQGSKRAVEMGTRSGGEGAEAVDGVVLAL
jgi:hypothetical protein